MSYTPTALPTTDSLRGAASSPVRDILALTERPGVVSFAGGLPAPELFDVAGLRDAFTAVLGSDDAGRALQYSTTEGRPRAQGRRRRAADRPWPEDERGRAPGHERVPAGACARRVGAA